MSRVLHVLAGAGVGGTERQLLLLLPQLATVADTRLVIIRGGPLTDRFADAVPTRTIRKLGKVDPVFLGRVVREIRRVRPDIVQTWGTTANVWGSAAARLSGVSRLIVTEGALDEWKGRIHRRIDGRVYRWADAVVCNSQRVADHLTAYGADPARTRVIANAVTMPARLHARQQPPRVVYLGRLHPVKGADVLLDAVPSIRAAVPQARFVIAGPAAQPVEREFATRLRMRAQEPDLNGSVHLTGAVADPSEVLDGAAVLVLPSRSEGSPNVVVEAMAAGVPVVATSVGGVPEMVVAGETGLLVPPDDPAALADAVVRCLLDADAAGRRAAAARLVVEGRHALPVVVQAWAALYRSVLAGRGELVST